MKKKYHEKKSEKTAKKKLKQGKRGISKNAEDSVMVGSFY